MHNPVEILKSDGRFFHAGALAFIRGDSNNYGCHYGMRSSRAFAIDEFRAGFASAERDYHKNVI